MLTTNKWKIAQSEANLKPVNQIIEELNKSTKKVVIGDIGNIRLAHFLKDLPVTLRIMEEVLLQNYWIEKRNYEQLKTSEDTQPIFKHIHYAIQEIERFKKIYGEQLPSIERLIREYKTPHEPTTT